MKGRYPLVDGTRTSANSTVILGSDWPKQIITLGKSECKTRRNERDETGDPAREKAAGKSHEKEERQEEGKKEDGERIKWRERNRERER